MLSESDNLRHLSSSILKRQTSRPIQYTGPGVTVYCNVYEWKYLLRLRRQDDNGANFVISFNLINLNTHDESDSAACTQAPTH